MSFGPDISVGGGPAGGLGPVTVTTPTEATAQLTIGPSAAIGSRTAMIATGLQQATLPNAFNVTSVAKVAVPNVLGQTQAAASNAFTTAGLKLGTVAQQGSAGTPPGDVISETPPAGTTVDHGATVNIILSLGNQIVAPPLDRTVATAIGSATSFLYSGPNPVQTGVAPKTIVPNRAAVLRGKVLDKTNAPIPGVTITVLNHPEFGQAQTRVDGLFDLAVNGGGLLTLNYARAGFLPAQRQVDAPWQDYAFAPDVVLIPYDSAGNTIDLTSPATIQVARGSPVSDSDGARQATLFVPGGTTAVLNMPDGRTTPITHLTVRGTEYTVGTNGANAMPGDLPPTSAYTYAIEWSVDEAIAAGAAGITFSQPVISYVENFLSYTVGEAVPVGYFDPKKGVWIASPNGAVIKILGATSGLADLDVDGSGRAASTAELAALGIVSAERQRLASLYPIGQVLWRAPVTHFTAIDMNFPFCPIQCGQADFPRQPSPQLPTPLSDPCKSTGSIIECENRDAGAKIANCRHAIHHKLSQWPGFENRRQNPGHSSEWRNTSAHRDQHRIAGSCRGQAIC